MSRSSQTPFDVSGRTVFITGAARGIGAATAERLHRKGANVALVGLEPEKLQELASRLGERAEAFEADVTDFEALTRAVDGTVERFGGIDVAIANAGVAFTGSLINAPVEQVERTLAVNLLGVWRTDRAVMEQLIARRGYLLNISSLSAIVHPPMIGAYATAKSGVDGLSDSLRAELRAQRRAGRLRLLRLPRHRPGARRLLPALCAGGQRQFPELHPQSGSSLEGDRRDRARHRAALGACLGAALGRSDDRAARAAATAGRTARASEPERMAEAIRLADPASDAVVNQDPLLGVAAQATKP